MAFNRILIIAFLGACLTFFYGCEIENAKAPKNPQICIASNFLSEKDSSLFENFAKAKNITVQLKCISTEEIITHLKSRGLDSEIDVVLLNSSYESYRLRRAKLTQHVNWGEQNIEIDPSFIANKYQFIGVGLNPFVYYNSKKSVPMRAYSDVRHYNFTNDLSKNQMISLVAQVYKNLRKIETYKWLNDFNNNAKKYFADSIPILSTYREVPKLVDSIKYGRTIHFPSVGNQGGIYDMVCLSIVYQTSHFNEAIELSKYLTNPENNREFALKTNIISLFDNSTQFRPFAMDADNICTYYSSAQRAIINSKKK